MSAPREVTRSLLYSGFNAKQLADGFATDHFEAGVFQHLVHLRFAEKINRTAKNILQPDLPDGHAPSPKARPCREECSVGHVANQTQTLGRLHDVIPEADGDGDVELFVCLPVQDIA